MAVGGRGGVEGAVLGWLLPALQSLGGPTEGSELAGSRDGSSMAGLFAFLQSHSASSCPPALALSLFPAPLLTHHSSGSCLFISSNGIRLQVAEQLK